MRKIATSTLGILLLNPMGCAGTPHEDTGTGGAQAGTGGYTGVVHCTPATASVCGPGQICKQTMFPVMPPVGVDSGMSDVSYLYQCVPAGTGGRSGTGGGQSSGGTMNTGGTKNTNTKVALKSPASVDQNHWWSTAEAALRKT